ncbi:MAG: protein O-GlcNAcase [Alphaproteobacteria bacterium]|nr:protein O-GlcNAcase [Alphaproteobacteria bacterium]
MPAPDKTSPQQNQTALPLNLRGYIEGYYGRLLDWDDRARIIEQIATLGMNTYFYAPKEDRCHRFDWRRPWDADWIAAFSRFCEKAHRHNVCLLGGIAPGLDYDAHDDAAEFARLLTKAQQLRDSGAHAVVLMFDDIDEPSDGGYGPDGLPDHALHADIASRLGARLDAPVLITPRVYADEMSGDPAAHYRNLSAALPDDMPLFHCGSHIVAGADPLATGTSLAREHLTQRLILWDNIYCNDYCPRRLFVGRHTGRDGIADLMLNGTGMIETDLLLLSAMQAGDDDAAWRMALAKAGVPDDFHALAPWFDLGVANDRAPSPPAAPEQAHFDAIETLLWRWKGPLAREWYPFLFGLKHDLLIETGQLPDLRVAKTQTPALARHLLQAGDGKNRGKD